MLNIETMQDLLKSAIEGNPTPTRDYKITLEYCLSMLEMERVKKTQPEVIVEKSLRTREDFLQEAIEVTMDIRNRTYGEPGDNFKNIAAFLNILFGPKLKEALTFQDAAMFPIVLKLARYMSTPSHKDNLVDIAGYAAIAGELIAYTENYYKHKASGGIAEALEKGKTHERS